MLKAAPEHPALAGSDRRRVNRLASTSPLQVTVVVPTINERGNLDPLLERVERALEGLEWELIFVDDNSSDGTPDRIAEIAQRDPRVRLIRRFDRRGLASAVVEGALASTAPVIAVMDADLQHDETIVPKLIRTLLSDEADVTVGTRYCSGGSAAGLNDRRLRMSRIATRAAEYFLKGSCSDPMSGLFAVRRETLMAARQRLSSTGYKILFDILISSPQRLRVTEVPYHFGERHSGESKLDNLVALEYLEMLLDKLVGRWIPPKLLMFGSVGAIGVLVHLGILDCALNLLSLRFSTAQIVAVAGAMTFNFALNNVFTYRDRRLRGLAWWRGLFIFYAVCAMGAIANVGVGSMLYQQSSIWWLAGLAGAVVGSVWNYVGSSWLAWRRRQA
jgi:dolichol-phosphate mannosyltransferase